MSQKPTYEELERKVKELEKEVIKGVHAEGALRDSEKKSRAWLEHSPVCTKMVDRDFNLQFMSSAGIEDLKIDDVTQFYGKPYPFYFYPDSFRRLTTKNLEAAKETGKVITQEESVVDIKGDELWYHSTIVPINDDEGRFDYIIVVSIDTTERKLAEEALKKAHNKLEHRVKERTAELIKVNDTLRESEKHYRTLISEMFNGFALHEILVDNNGKPSDYRFLEVNLAFEEMTGLKRDNILGKKVLEVLPKTESHWIETYGEVALTGKSIRVENYSQEFDKYFEVLAYSPQKRQFATVFTEITDRKQAEEALKRTQFMVDRAWDAIYWMGPDAHFIYVNDAACQALGYSREELLTMTVHDIGPEFPAEVWPEHWADLQRRGSFTIETLHRRKNGSNFPVEIVVNYIKIGGREFNCAFARDITERKKIQEELLRAQKLESIGILSGGIAHDFNNLLSVIVGNIELAKDDIKFEVGVSEFLAEVEKASVQAQDLTKQLITFSKGGAPVRKIGSIGELVKETTNFSILGANVKCEFSIPHDLWFVDFDEGQMKHAINNMIVNAVEAMPDSGTIAVRAENINITAERDLPLPEGRYVKIFIRDHGVGISEEHLSQIFDPYFSTKEIGKQKGMGLGLATTYSIINKHDGHITVESEVGVGTTFTLYLPAHEKDIRKLKPVEIPKPEKPAVLTGKVLAMDDEEMIRNLSAQVLRRLGYEPELAQDGAEAIELYKKAMDSGKPFDAVILDLTVKGGMGGKDAVKALLRLDPQIKAIVSSGYSNDPVMTNFEKYGFIGALPKPYTMKELSVALNKVTTWES